MVIYSCSHGESSRGAARHDHAMHGKDHDRYRRNVPAHSHRRKCMRMHTIVLAIVVIQRCANNHAYDPIRVLHDRDMYVYAHAMRMHM